VYILLESDKQQSVIYTMQDENKIFEDLMVDYLSGNISDHDERILSDLLQSDFKYKEKYIEMAKTRAISFIPALEKEKKSNYSLVSKSIRNAFDLKTRHNFFFYFSRIAAVILFVLSTSIASFYILNDSLLIANNMVSCETVVPLGSQAKVILPDGTVAWLNSGSTLKYDNRYGKTKREVSLTGEGYFEVEKDKSKPFLVHTNNLEIKVLGTVFNVRAYIDDPTVEVNLLEGKVDISILNKLNTKKVTLLPNEKMVYDKKSNSMLSSTSEASKSAQWTIGKLCFVDASLAEITNDLERKYDVQISIETDEIKDEIFSGSLDLNQPLDEILEYIDVDKKFSKTIIGKRVLIKCK